MLSRLILPALLCVGSLPLVARGQLSATADFEGASAKVLSIDHGSRTIRITPAGQAERGWPCWWYLRVDGLRRDASLTLEVQPSSALLVGPSKNRGKPLVPAWALPTRASYSSDGRTWRQTEPGRALEMGMAYTITADGDTLWIAWGPPFTPADAAALVRSLAQDCRGAEEFDLCRSNGDRPCPALRLKEGDRPDQERPAVWLQARQHAWESGSSWVARGLGEWLASDDPAARRLRQTCEITLVPIMDIDSTATGNGGKEALPQDHNRDWTDKPHYAEIAAAQKHLLRYAAEKRLALFIDLHNPGPTDRQPFFYRCPDETLVEIGVRNVDRFLTICRGELAGPLALAPEPRTSGAGYDPLWRQMSKNWVAANGPPHAVSLTLETAWNTPDSGTDGYRTVGAQLGMAIEKYLRSDPTK